MTDMEFIKAELQKLQKTLEARADMYIRKDNWNQAKNLLSFATACSGALELLKEQEAKRVIRKQCKKEHDDGSIDYFAEWYCPHCNSLILRGFDNLSIKFCYKCGKPIKWEGR